MAPFAHDHDEIASDLKATLAARRELGPEMDEEVIELLIAFAIDRGWHGDYRTRSF